MFTVGIDIRPIDFFKKETDLDLYRALKYRYSQISNLKIYILLTLCPAANWPLNWAELPKYRRPNVGITHLYKRRCKF